MYKFKRGRPAIVTEIYLPTRYALNPNLRKEVFEGSLSPETVADHFADVTHKEAIGEFLPPKLEPEYDRLVKSIPNSKRSFTGYSSHTIDGVWWDEDEERVDRDPKFGEF